MKDLLTQQDCSMIYDIQSLSVDNPVISNMDVTED